jgi:hypothetical protein
MDGRRIPAGSTVKTIFNSGSKDGMSYQCFWISILDFLNRNGYPDLTLRQLRNNAGLRRDTENRMFDNAYKNSQGFLIFHNAAVQIAELYNLSIQVYTTDHRGRVSQIRATFEPAFKDDRTRNVNISQFGLYHFQLIDNLRGSTFDPLIKSREGIIKYSKANAKQKEKYENPQLKEYYNELSKLTREYDQAVIEIRQSKHIDNNLLRQLKKKYDESVKEQNNLIKAINESILEEERKLNLDKKREMPIVPMRPTLTRPTSAPSKSKVNQMPMRPTLARPTSTRPISAHPTSTRPTTTPSKSKVNSIPAPSKSKVNSIPMLPTSHISSTSTDHKSQKSVQNPQRPTLTKISSNPIHPLYLVKYKGINKDFIGKPCWQFMKNEFSNYDIDFSKDPTNYIIKGATANEKVFFNMCIAKFKEWQKEEKK